MGKMYIKTQNNYTTFFCLLTNFRQRHSLTPVNINKRRQKNVHSKIVVSAWGETTS